MLRSHHPHYRASVAATLGAATAHLYLSVLGFIGFLNYTVGTTYELLNQVAADFLWAWIHGAVALVLVTSLFKAHTRFREMSLPALACNIAFAAMFTWAFFNLIWGLSTVRPVSLAGPGLAFAVAAGEQLLANAWNRKASTKER